MGNQPNLNPNKYRSIIAVKKYGKELINAKLGGTIESNFPSLLQAINIPANDPSINEIISEKPTSSKVQPNPDNMIVETFSGKYAVEIPKSPWKRCLKYKKYFFNNGSFVKPKVCFRASIASGFNFPLKLANITDIGSPGIKRGMKKFNVMAAHPAII